MDGYTNDKRRLYKRPNLPPRFTGLLFLGHRLAGCFWLCYGNIEEELQLDNLLVCTGVRVQMMLYTVVSLGSRLFSASAQIIDFIPAELPDDRDGNRRW